MGERDQDGASTRFITDGKVLVLTPWFSPDGSKRREREIREKRERGERERGRE